MNKFIAINIALCLVVMGIIFSVMVGDLATQNKQIFRDVREMMLSN